MKFSKGFTLIELMVVISIIAILATLGMVAYGRSQMVARDARRKQDLDEISKYLQLYYNDYHKYPQAGTIAYGTQGYVNSTIATDMWISSLAGYADRLPKDPVNDSFSLTSDTGYAYAYGNVSTDGQHFDLIAKFENDKDGDRCGKVGYKYLKGFTSSYLCPGDTNQFDASSPNSNKLFSASIDR